MVHDFLRSGVPPAQQRHKDKVMTLDYVKSLFSGEGVLPDATT
jgi:hypothetical protein